MTAIENVELPMMLANQHLKKQISGKVIKQRAKILLKRVGLSDRLNHLPSEMSGEEK